MQRLAGAVVFGCLSWATSAGAASGDGGWARVEAGCVAALDTPTLRLVLNIPAYRLEVYEGADRMRTYPVAVGKATHETPTGEYRITKVTWNPWWHPPDSPWAAGQPITPPGPTNPMGRVKLFFEELYFIHGTPAEHSLGSAASHGCVRMANRDAIELGRLVHAHGSPGLDAGTIDSLVARPRTTRTIPLEAPVPLEIRYDLARLEAGELELYPDAYARARGRRLEWVVGYLASVGIPPESVDVERLREQIELSARVMVTVPLDRIVKPVASMGPGGPFDRFD